jgi:hypothetical protein
LLDDIGLGFLLGQAGDAFQFPNLLIQGFGNAVFQALDFLFLVEEPLLLGGKVFFLSFQGLDAAVPGFLPC